MNKMVDRVKNMKKNGLKKYHIQLFVLIPVFLLFMLCSCTNNKDSVKEKQESNTVEKNIIEKVEEDIIETTEDLLKIEDESHINESESIENNHDMDNQLDINPRKEVIIALDPGHQSENVDMSELEPNAPDSEEMKAKATSGTEGRFTGVPEYKLNLDIALNVRDRLINLGYTVIMTREDNDTAISNMERACLANDAGADVSIRIHANGCDDASVSGALALIGSSNNSYVGELYDESYYLAECVLNNYCDSTGMINQGIITSDTMTGINWSKIPVMILEMGYMTNESDDFNMQDSDYQNKMVDGIVNGVEEYFGFSKYDNSNNDIDKTPSLLSEDSIVLESFVKEKLRYADAEGCRCSVYLKNLSTGEVIDLSKGKQKAASIIKLFVGGAVYSNYDKLLNAGYTRDEIEYLVSIMISESNNEATNELVTMLGDSDTDVGMSIVNNYIASLGYTNTSMGRLMLDFESDKENYVDSFEVGDYLEKLYIGKEIKDSDKIIQYMKQQIYTEKIPSVLPEYIITANKTGDLVDVDNDAAIIYGEKVDYIICIFADELDRTDISSQIIKQISLQTYECWN